MATRTLLNRSVLGMTLAIFSWGSLHAQSDSPCECTQRWEDGAHWNPNATIDDAPNAPEEQGIIRCGSSAETQSQVEPGGCVYNPAQFLIDVAGGGCVEPSSGNTVS